MNQLYFVGTVTRDNIKNITDIAKLLSTIMSSDPTTTSMFTEITEKIIFVIQRYDYSSCSLIRLLPQGVSIIYRYTLDDGKKIFEQVLCDITATVGLTGQQSGSCNTSSQTLSGSGML